MKTRILVALVAVFALFAVTAGSATAAPQKDVTYSYNEYLPDRDGVVHLYYFSATVHYNKDGTAQTSCSYGKVPNGGPVSQQTYDGSYIVPYAVPDKSYGGLRSFCLAHFEERTF
jgi:hypothetical protein